MYKKNDAIAKRHYVLCDDRRQRLFKQCLYVVYSILDL